MRDFQSVFGYLPQIVPALLGDLTAGFADIVVFVMNTGADGVGPVKFRMQEMA